MERFQARNEKNQPGGYAGVGDDGMIPPALYTASGSSLTVVDESTTLTTAATKLTFTGDGVVATEPVADQVTVTIAGSSAWTQTVDDALSSLTNMTSVAGTWAIGGGVTQQTDTTANARTLRTTAKKNSAEIIAEVEMRFDSGSGLRRFGLAVGSAGTVNDGAATAYLTGDGASAWTLSTERAGVLALTSGDSVTYTAGNWLKLRMHATGGMTSVWADGTLIVGVGGMYPATRALYVALYTYQAAASFRNLKVWTPTLPA